MLSLDRHQLTALRLEMWLRSFLCDAAGGGRFGTGFDLNLIPDVFRTARTIARAVSRHASALITAGNQGDGAGGNENRRFCSADGSGGVEPSLLFQANGAGDQGGDARANDYRRFFSDDVSGGVEPFQLYTANGDSDYRGAAGEREPLVIGELESPRRALIGRLGGVPQAGAFVSWVSSLVKTVKQYRRWFPWQPFADELRGLLRGVREQPGPAAGRGDGGGVGRRDAAPAAAAGMFAACELLLAWEGVQVIFLFCF